MVKLNRRQTLRTLGAGAAVLAAPGIIGQAHADATKVRVGYLPAIPSDAQIGLADHFDFWREEDLEIEEVKFGNGVEQFQALVGGSLDVLSAGAALANFPSRGQGKVFLANFLEKSSTQIWGNPKMGVTSLKDLKGKKVATARGTTAEFLLETALASVGLAVGEDVELVNQPLAGAVTSFITGSVPAVAIWVPFNVQIEQRMPSAKMITNAGKFFPKTAVLDGWAANNAFYKNNRDALVKIARGWAKANTYLHDHKDEALKILHAERYPNLPMETVQVMLSNLGVYSNAEWRKLYQDGTITGWLQHTTDFFAKAGHFTPSEPAEQYFDKSIYLDAIPA
jgi:NitT/TauT family transport system substrate-binding protein